MFSLGAVEILKPFDEITTDLSFQTYPSLSKVIPAVRLLERHLMSLEGKAGTVSCLKDLIRELLTELSHRFRMVENNTPLTLSTFLDPR